MAEAHPASISVPAVAKRAGVGVATVYRYFPTKEALLDASAMVLGDDAKLTSLDAYPSTFEEATTLLPDQFAAIARQLPLARNQLSSPLGRQLRQVRWQAKQASLARALAGSGIDPDSAGGPSAWPRSPTCSPRRPPCWSCTTRPASPSTSPPTTCSGR